MNYVLAGILSIALAGADGLESRGLTIVSASMTERDLRETSARLYSDLLRVACANGWKFTRQQISSGFRRHFAETRLVLIGQGVTIMPLDHVPVLVMTETAPGFVEPFWKKDRRSCFVGHWREARPAGLQATSELDSSRGPMR